MRTFMQWAALGIASLALYSATLRADVLFNDLGPGDTFDNNAGRVVTGENYVSFGNVDQAMPFKVGPGGALFTSADIGVYHVSGDASTDVYLMDSNGNAPGSNVLASMSINNIGTFPAVLRSVSPGASVPLNANTTYWIVLDAHNDADLAWCFSTDGTVGYAGRSGNPPGAWNWEPNDQAMALRINGTNLPEPALLGALGILPVALRRRRIQ